MVTEHPAQTAQNKRDATVYTAVLPGVKGEPRAGLQEPCGEVTCEEDPQKEQERTSGGRALCSAGSLARGVLPGPTDICAPAGMVVRVCVRLQHVPIR